MTGDSDLLLKSNCHRNKTISFVKNVIFLSCLIIDYIRFMVDTAIV